MKETVRYIKIDEHLESYKTIFNHDWAREIDALSANTKLDKAVVELSLRWKAAANAHVMPWLMMKCMASMSQAFYSAYRSRQEFVSSLSQHLGRRLGGTLTVSSKRSWLECLRDCRTNSAQRPSPTLLRREIPNRCGDFLSSATTRKLRWVFGVPNRSFTRRSSLHSRTSSKT